MEGLAAWAKFGRTLLNGEDQDCTGFRQHACRTMLANKLQIAMYLETGVSNHDTQQRHFNQAMTAAKEHGYALATGKTAMDNEEQWAAAILHPQTHFKLPEQVVCALLDLVSFPDFSRRLTTFSPGA